MQVQLESVTKRKLTLVFAVAVLLPPVLGLIGWAAGPEYIINEEIDRQGTAFDQPGFQWSHSTGDLSYLNEFLLVMFTPHHKNYKTSSVSDILAVRISAAARLVRRDGSYKGRWVTGVSEHDEMITRTVSCGKGRAKCSPARLLYFPVVHYNEYRFNFTLTETPDWIASDGDVHVVYANASFLSYEMWVRFLFIAGTIAMLVRLNSRLRFFDGSDTTVEQRWIHLLLWVLVLGNNPLFPLELFIEHWSVSFINVFCQQAFNATLFLFWLVVLDGYRWSKQQRTYWKFYAPKLMLVTSIWVFGMILTFWDRVHDLDHPTYEAVDEIPGWSLISTLYSLLLITYLLSLLYVMIRGHYEVRRIQYLSARWYVLFGLTVMVIVLLLAAGFGFARVRSKASSGLFLFFVALENIYVWTLAFLYEPSDRALADKGGGSSDMRMVEFTDDPSAVVDDLDED